MIIFRIIPSPDHSLCHMLKLPEDHQHHHPGDKITVNLLLKILDHTLQLIIIITLLWVHLELSVIGVPKEATLRTSAGEKKSLCLACEIGEHQVWDCKDRRSNTVSPASKIHVPCPMNHMLEYTVKISHQHQHKPQQDPRNLFQKLLPHSPQETNKLQYCQGSIGRSNQNPWSSWIFWRSKLPRHP